MRELLTIGKVWELAQADRRTPGAEPYDLVILDAPATGHGVAVLTAPRTFAGAARVGPIARQGAYRSTRCSPTRRAPASSRWPAPEEMPVNETLALRDALRDELGSTLDARRRQRRAARRASPPPTPRRWRAAARRPARCAPRCAPTRARARAQRSQLRRLRRGLARRRRSRTLPFVFDARDAARRSTRLGRRLERGA